MQITDTDSMYRLFAEPNISSQMYPRKVQENYERGLLAALHGVVGFVGAPDLCC